MRMLTAKGIRGFMALAPRLGELHLGWNEEVDGHAKVDFAELHSALIRISGSLESLAINTHWNDTEMNLLRIPVQSLYSAPLGSMKQFHARRHLSLSIELLVGVTATPWERDALCDLLPPKLERLRLNHDSMTWGQQKEIIAGGGTHGNHYLQDFVNVLR
ncbi:hypothetical protein BDW59DRAFT_165688 [Aspergillus cavernicola]|uniref:Uncharacterized protein n=1 Tax=Aspergillus cavernicola TaxID=176166 RepID=A0ABR4HRK1_9EURO